MWVAVAVWQGASVAQGHGRGKKSPDLGVVLAVWPPKNLGRGAELAAMTNGMAGTDGTYGSATWPG